MKKFFVLMLLTVICTVQIAARPIVLRREGFFQHRGMRMPSSICLYADLEEDVLTINISNYSGIIYVDVYNTQGTDVFSANSVIVGNGVVAFDLSDLTEGEYLITITLEDVIYSGRFVK